MRRVLLVVLVSLFCASFLFSQHLDPPVTYDRIESDYGNMMET